MINLIMWQVSQVEQELQCRWRENLQVFVFDGRGLRPPVQERVWFAEENPGRGEGVCACVAQAKGICGDYA